MRLQRSLPLTFSTDLRSGRPAWCVFGLFGAGRRCFSFLDELASPARRRAGSGRRA